MLCDEAQKIDGVISEGYRNVKYTAATVPFTAPTVVLFDMPSTQKSFCPLVQLETPHPEENVEIAHLR